MISEESPKQQTNATTVTESPQLQEQLLAVIVTQSSSNAEVPTMQTPNNDADEKIGKFEEEKGAASSPDEELICINLENLKIQCETIDNNTELKKTVVEKSKKIRRSRRRTSTPTNEHCFHCAHHHSLECCLYVYDEPEDGVLYAHFKYQLENVVPVIEQSEKSSNNENIENTNIETDPNEEKKNTTKWFRCNILNKFTKFYKNLFVR